MCVSPDPNIIYEVWVNKCVANILNASIFKNFRILLIMPIDFDIINY